MADRRAGTTDDDPEGGSAPAEEDSEDAVPTLILGFAPGARGDERCGLPAGGLLLGRDALVFPGGVVDDHRLSRRHAEVSRDGAAWVLRDLGSRNGTYVGGQRLTEPHRLRPGEVIRVGASVLLFTVAPPVEADPASLLLGASTALAAVRRAVARVAPTRHVVLVTGETGAGKELVAQELHRLRARPGRWVAVNCGALAEGLLESELFGHVRGAFTGASDERPGLFRAADRGTLLLDEVGDLPAALQVKLLRAIETGLVRPVGGAGDVAVDVAVVSATNRNLIEEVRAQRFRADLYARLAQWTIAVPPLRDRRADIPGLARGLLARIGAGRRTVAPKLGEALLEHPWPLNVRGLLNALSTAVLSSPEEGPLDLVPEVLRALDDQRALTSSPVAAPPDSPPPLPDAAELARVLERCQGQVSTAARLLGCTRQQLYRWAKKHALDIDSFRS